MRGLPGIYCQNFFAQARRTAVSIFGFAALWLLMSCASLQAQGAPFSISSSSFPNDGVIPKQFSCDGPDVSPALAWTEPPAGAKTFALLADDPDAPAGNWNHWAIWNIPAGARSLPEGVGKSRRLPDGSEQGMNDFKKVGYNGPCPPANKPHHYHFKLYALDTQLSLKGDAGKPELERAMKGHILAQAELTGTFHH